MNKQRYAKIGIFHHDCWYTKAINAFPVEIKQVVHRWDGPVRTGVKDTSYTLQVTGPHAEIPKLIRSIRRNPTVSSVVKVSGGSAPLITVTWKTPGTVYEHIIHEDCPYVSNVYSTNGLETFDIVANDFRQMKRAISAAEDVGEVKILQMSDSFKRDTELTTSQWDALFFAYKNSYYTWPRRKNLKSIASLFGRKRRTFQENLRRAEAKFIPMMLEEFNKKN